MSVQGMGPQGEKVVVQEGGAQLLDKDLRVSWTLGGRCRRGVIRIAECGRGLSFSFRTAADFSVQSVGSAISLLVVRSQFYCLLYETWFPLL